MVKQSVKLERPSSSILFESEKFYSLSILENYIKEILDDPAAYDLHVTYGDEFKVEAKYDAELFVSGSWVMMRFYACDTDIYSEYRFIRVKDMNILDDDEIEQLVSDALFNLIDKKRNRIESILSEIYEEEKAEAKALSDTEDFINANLYRW